MKTRRGTDASRLTALAGAGLVLLTTGAIVAASIVARMPKLDLSGGTQVAHPSLSAPGAIALPGEPEAPAADPTRGRGAQVAGSQTEDRVVALAVPASGAQDDALRRAAAEGGDVGDRGAVVAKIDRGRGSDRVAARADAHGAFAPNGWGGDGPEGSATTGRGKKLGHFKAHRNHKVKAAKSHPAHPSKVHGKPDDDDEAEESGDDHDGDPSKGDDTASGHSRDPGAGKD